MRIGRYGRVVRHSSSSHRIAEHSKARTLRGATAWFDWIRSEICASGRFGLPKSPARHSCRVNPSPTCRCAAADVIGVYEGPCRAQGKHAIESGLEDLDADERLRISRSTTPAAMVVRDGLPGSSPPWLRRSSDGVAAKCVRMRSPRPSPRARGGYRGRLNSEPKQPCWDINHIPAIRPGGSYVGVSIRN